MEKFPIVDTHVHLWHPEQLRYPWLSEVPALNSPYLLKDYIEAYGDIGNRIHRLCPMRHTPR